MYAECKIWYETIEDQNTKIKWLDSQIVSHSHMLKAKKKVHAAAAHANHLPNVRICDRDVIVGGVIAYLWNCYGGL